MRATAGLSLALVASAPAAASDAGALLEAAIAHHDPDGRWACGDVTCEGIVGWGAIDLRNVP